jgi:glucan phosphoethanolaminetransferase (alkaline phosphatase superfamily)
VAILPIQLALVWSAVLVLHQGMWSSVILDKASKLGTNLSPLSFWGANGWTFVLFVMLPALIISIVKGWIRPRSWVRSLIVWLQCGWQSLILIFLYADGKSFAVLGTHLDDAVVVNSFTSQGAMREAELGFSTWMTVAFAVVAATVGQYLLARFLESGPVIKRTMTLRMLAAAVVVPIGFSVVGEQGTDQSSESFRLFRAGTLGSATEERIHRTLALKDSLRTPQAFEARTPQPYFARGSNTEVKTPSVLMILVESLRRDVFTPELMPNLSRWKQSQRCIESDHHHANGHTTEYGVFSALYGAPAYHYEGVRLTQAANAMMRAMKESGYRFIGASSSQMLNWKGAGFIFNGFDPFEQFLQQPFHVADEEMVNWLRKFVPAEELLKQPHFLFTFLSSTHHNYSFPEAFAKHQPVLPEDYNHFIGDAELEKTKIEIMNRYKNATMFVDHKINQLLEHYADVIARGELVVIVTGDHGEEFWDQGLLGHAAVRLIQSRIEVPLVFCGGNVPPTQVGVSTHADLAPTIMQLLGWERETMPWLGQSLLTTHPTYGRMGVVTATGFPFDHRDVVILSEKGKYGGNSKQECWLQKSKCAQRRIFRISHLN